MATKAEAPDNLYDAAIMLLRSWVAWFDTEPRSVLVANLITDTRALLREEGQRDVFAADLAPAGEGCEWALIDQVDNEHPNTYRSNCGIMLTRRQDWWKYCQLCGKEIKI